VESGSFQPKQKTHAPLPEVIASATTGIVMKEPASPFVNQAEIIQEGPAAVKDTAFQIQDRVCPVTDVDTCRI